MARALVARGVTKETRVGLMATNRPEWVSALFGIALAGGTVVVMSTFATQAELEYQLRMGDVSLLIFERSIVERDLAAELVGLCPDIGAASGEIRSPKLPFLRRLVCIGDRTRCGRRDRVVVRFSAAGGSCGGGRWSRRSRMRSRRPIAR